MRLLALDPGEKVGWATAVTTGSGDTTLGGLVINQHGISHLKDMALAVYRTVVVERKYDVVIYETWRLRPDKARQFIGNDFPAVQFIGMVRLCCWLGGTKVVAQGPKVMATADRLLEAGHYPDVKARIDAAPASHDESHDTSALRHLVNYHWSKT